MSEEINNRVYRQTVIKELLLDLHNGKNIEEVKTKFEKAFSGVAASEISEAEQALIAGGLPVEEVQKLCDVHAAVFKDTLQKEKEQLPKDLTKVPGHPLETLKQENRAIEQVIETNLNPALESYMSDDSFLIKIKQALKLLSSLNIHYQKKENLLFPYMEQYGITAPPKVMWGVDDEIRNLLKQSIDAAEGNFQNKPQLKQIIEETVFKITEMIFKEENILFPMLLETLSLAEWKQIASESKEIGYCLIPAPPAFEPKTDKNTTASNFPDNFPDVGGITLPTGVLKINELVSIFNTLPLDVTFVDKNDTVKYFSESSERIFPRTNSVIGRKVVNCHPPASVSIVEGILNDFKTGKKTHEDFWIKMNEKYVYIRYFALKDENNEYIGTLEVTQNIAPVQAITGEKRLVEN